MNWIQLLRLKNTKSLQQLFIVTGLKLIEAKSLQTIKEPIPFAIADLPKHQRLDTAK